MKSTTERKRWGKLQKKTEVREREREEETRPNKRGRETYTQ